MIDSFVLASRDKHPKSTVVRVRDAAIGDSTPAIIADAWPNGDSEQVIRTARLARTEGADILSFSFVHDDSARSSREVGLEELELLREVALASGLPVIVEVSSARDVERAQSIAEAMQVGPTNMQNFRLLIELGHSACPVVLNRGQAATINEWLLAAEYILAGGNKQVILCECGIRTFETETERVLDLGAVARVRELSHLPVIVDPSHGTGRRTLVAPMAKAAIAAGADGVKIRVSTDADNDREPNLGLSPSEFSELSRGLKSNWKASVSANVGEHQELAVHS